MANAVILTPLEADLAIHQKLPDEPNDVGGLTAQVLKETFDKAGLVIQDYLNNTHLPQETQALTQTLTAAKQYTDQKVVAIGAADMASSIYDTNRQRKDVYNYADQTAATAAALAVGRARFFDWCLMGNSGSVSSGFATLVSLQADSFDGKGMLNISRNTITIPQGATKALLELGVIWRHYLFSTCTIQILKNGVIVHIITGPENNDAKYAQQTLLIPMTVTAGEVYTLHLFTNGPEKGEEAYVRLDWLKLQILG